MTATSTFRRPLSTTDAKWIVEQACRAPSIHNTQPWRFQFDAGTFELRADTRRGLSASDPTGRELVISCGAALYNLRVAVRKLGYTPTVSLLPTNVTRVCSLASRSLSRIPPTPPSGVRMPG